MTANGTVNSSNNNTMTTANGTAVNNNNATNTENTTAYNKPHPTHTNNTLSLSETAAGPSPLGRER